MTQENTWLFINSDEYHSAFNESLVGKTLILLLL